MKNTLTAKTPNFTYRPNNFKINLIKVFTDKAEYLKERERIQILWMWDRNLSVSENYRIFGERNFG